MSAIGGISNNSYSSYSSYGKIASGNKLQSAADGASELSIAERQNVQATGLNVGSDNMASAGNLLNVADGALGNIGDSLQRIRELSLQAMNTMTVTDNDRQNIQKEIDQLKQDISDIANNTTYNTKNLLDGSLGTLNLATDSNGNSQSVDVGTATLDALGLKDYDVTKNFNIETIDSALSKVNSQRGSIGAQTNRLEYGMNYNSYAAYNTTSSQSRLQDLDMPKAISEMKKKQTLQQYALSMQQRRMQDQKNLSTRLFQTTM